MITATCPICKKQVQFERLSDQPFLPFCSDRCKLVDLGRWIDGTYQLSRELNEEEQAELEEVIEQKLREMGMEE